MCKFTLHRSHFCIGHHIRTVFAMSDEVVTLGNLDSHKVTVLRLSFASGQFAVIDTHVFGAFALLLHVTPQHEIITGTDESLVCACTPLTHTRSRA